MRIKTYVINLPRSVERREYIRKETAKYPFLDVEWVEGVDGRGLTEEELDGRFDRKRFMRQYNKRPAPSEIGCTLSHHKCYEKLLASDEEVVLILEDDVAFVSAENTEKIMHACVHLLKKEKTDILIFSQQMYYFTESEPLTGAYTVHPVYKAYGTFAYLVTRRGATYLLRNKRPFILADDYGWMRKKGLKVKCVLPEVAKECSAEEGLDSLIVGRKLSGSYTRHFFLIRIWNTIRFKAERMYLYCMKGRIINHRYQ